MNEYKVCSNCNQIGHVYKNCQGPIISIGIIAFRKSSTDSLTDYFKSIMNASINRESEHKILLIQRKDTMGYVDLIRGKYPETDFNDYIYIYLSEMIPEEINKLLTLTFDQLWDDIWFDHTSKYYKNDKNLAKKKYDLLNIQQFIGSNNKQLWKFQEFGIPKGRRNIREKFRNCAIREFEEETNYSPEHYQIIDGIGTIEEKFIGSNGIHYKHIYYIALVDKSAPPSFIDMDNTHQSNEIRSIGWFTIQESLQLFRSYDTEKKKVIIKAFDVLNMILLNKPKYLIKKFIKN